FNADEDPNDEGWVSVLWQGDAQRQTEALGEQITTLALERYVRLHGTGASEEAIAAELWFMAKHFHFKTGCEIYLPSLSEPPHPLAKVGCKALEIGQGVLINLVTPRP